MNLAKMIPRMFAATSSRVFVAEPTIHLQVSYFTFEVRVHCDCVRVEIPWDWERKIVIVIVNRCFWKSAKEKEADKACEIAKEETESIKEQATQIKEASQSITDMASSTTKAVRFTEIPPIMIPTIQRTKLKHKCENSCRVKNLTKEVKQEVFKTADVVVDKMKGPIQGAVSHAWDKASKNIEDKVPYTFLLIQ
ncbi:hypothetical protein Cgig2_013947 [Carnegiea gigantea]|uniref:Uncharacterized protein n=1 Tax=Carnegiea gigantea TaxID=171969 RepID=A0A9Q1KWJ2_9CARY|nr:hypothetical protein Cgig2_013947 [Carnegiea gigantea]